MKDPKNLSKERVTEEMNEARRNRDFCLYGGIISIFVGIILFFYIGSSRLLIYIVDFRYSLLSLAFIGGGVIALVEAYHYDREYNIYKNMI